MRFVVLFACILVSACAIGAQTDAPQSAIDGCKFQAMQRDGVAWPDEVALCLKGKGYAVY